MGSAAVPEKGCFPFSCLRCFSKKTESAWKRWVIRILWLYQTDSGGGREHRYVLVIVFRGFGGRSGIGVDNDLPHCTEQCFYQVLKLLQP